MGFGGAADSSVLSIWSTLVFALNLKRQILTTTQTQLNQMQLVGCIDKNIYTIK